MTNFQKMYKVRSSEDNFKQIKVVGRLLHLEILLFLLLFGLTTSCSGNEITCTTDHGCSSLEICDFQSKKCVCYPDFETAKGSCPFNHTLNSNCSRSQSANFCAENQVCNEDSRCECSPDSIQKWNFCWTVSKLNENCKFSQQCQSKGQMCELHSHRCACELGTESDGSCSVSKVDTEVILVICCCCVAALMVIFFFVYTAKKKARNGQKRGFRRLASTGECHVGTGFPNESAIIIEDSSLQASTMMPNTLETRPPPTYQELRRSAQYNPAEDLPPPYDSISKQE